MKTVVAGIDPATKRCVNIGYSDSESLREMFDQGLILVPVTSAEAAAALHNRYPDIFKLNSERSAHAYPTINTPEFKYRIEAAFVAVANRGAIGLRTRQVLMQPSTDLDRDSCTKFATIVLSRLTAAFLESLPAERSVQIQQELADYLSSNFEHP